MQNIKLRKPTKQQGFHFSYHEVSSESKLINVTYIESIPQVSFTLQIQNLQIKETWNNIISINALKITPEEEIH